MFIFDNKYNGLCIQLSGSRYYFINLKTGNRVLYGSELPIPEAVDMFAFKNSIT